MTYVHLSQYAVGNSDTTRHSGCTWTAGATGVAATTDGIKHPTPDAIHLLVARTEETSPTTPGWSLADLVLALHRYGIGFVDHSGEGWDGFTAQVKEHYCVLAGVSAMFADSTCSGAFEGDHAIGVHPLTKVDVTGVLWRWIDDPICPTGRWERDSVLRRYAEAFSPSVRFGAFVDPVPSRPRTWVARVRPLSFWNRYYRLAGVLRRERRFTISGFHAPCKAPAPVTYAGTRIVLAEITSGGYDNSFVAPAGYAVTVKEV